MGLPGVISPYRILEPQEPFEGFIHEFIHLSIEESQWFL